MQHQERSDMSLAHDLDQAGIDYRYNKLIKHVTERVIFVMKIIGYAVLASITLILLVTIIIPFMVQLTVNAVMDKNVRIGAIVTVILILLVVAGENIYDTARKVRWNHTANWHYGLTAKSDRTYKIKLYRDLVRKYRVPNYVEMANNDRIILFMNFFIKDVLKSGTGAYFALNYKDAFKFPAEDIDRIKALVQRVDYHEPEKN